MSSISTQVSMLSFKKSEPESYGQLRNLVNEITMDAINTYKTEYRSNKPQ